MVKYVIKKEKLIEELNKLPADTELILNSPSMPIFGSREVLMLTKYS